MNIRVLGLIFSKDNHFFISTDSANREINALNCGVENNKLPLDSLVSMLKSEKIGLTNGFQQFAILEKEAQKASYTKTFCFVRSTELAPKGGSRKSSEGFDITWSPSQYSRGKVSFDKSLSFLLPMAIASLENSSFFANIITE